MHAMFEMGHATGVMLLAFAGVFAAIAGYYFRKGHRYPEDMPYGRSRAKACFRAAMACVSMAIGCVAYAVPPLLGPGPYLVWVFNIVWPVMLLALVSAAVFIVRAFMAANDDDTAQAPGTRAR